MKRSEFIKIVIKVIEKVEASVGTDKSVYTCNEIKRLSGDKGNLGTRMRNNYVSHLGVDLKSPSWKYNMLAEIPIGFNGRSKREQDARRLMALSIYLIVALDSKIYKRL